MTKVDPKPGTRRARVAAAIGLVFAVAAWIGCAGLALLVLLRLTGHDRGTLVSTIETFMLYLFVPAWVVLIFAAASGRRWLAALSLALVITHLVNLYPEMHRSPFRAAAMVQAPTLRLFSANVYANNPDVRGIIDELRASNADVVFIQEYADKNRAAFERSGVLDSYPYRVVLAKNSSFGSLLASRLPFVDSGLREIGDVRMPWAVVSTAIGPVEMVSVHLNRPLTNEENPGWQKSFTALEAMIRDRTRPVVLMGDYNATTAHGPFRALLGRGMIDAHQYLGRGLVNSWPNDKPYPPLIRIDHLLTTPEVRAVSVRNGTGAGSDHRPMLAEVALLGGGTR